jgi:hypothetical protein
MVPGGLGFCGVFVGEFWGLRVRRAPVSAGRNPASGRYEAAHPWLPALDSRQSLVSEERNWRTENPRFRLTPNSPKCTVKGDSPIRYTLEPNRVLLVVSEPSQSFDLTDDSRRTRPRSRHYPTVQFPVYFGTNLGRFVDMTSVVNPLRRVFTGTFQPEGRDGASKFDGGSC